jgi:hypothetical protein
MPNSIFRALFSISVCAIVVFPLVGQKPNDTQTSSKPPYRKAPTGYDKTPMLPGQPWRVHDGKRPHPKVVEPGTFSTQSKPGQPPSDAIVLFDGKNLDKWSMEYKERRGQGQPRGPLEIRPAGWTVKDGYFEVVPGMGSLITKEEFGDIQLHLEFMTPPELEGDSQWRANSGIIFMKRYEMQVLDSYNNPTYADGQAGAIYGQYPPLVNPVRKPGEWQIYDIVFEAPKFDDGKLVKPAHFTAFLNGVLLHNRQAAIGRMAHQEVGTYEAHDAEEPLLLQDHDVHVRFRNIWVRRLKGYDAQ